MDTQDFLDALTTWTESYRDARDPEMEWPASEDPLTAKWEENMLKVVAVISPADSLIGTPALERVRQAIGIAKLKDRSKLKKIYDILNEVENYLKAF